MITLVKTCEISPEQYDAMDENGQPVGYLRVRWGWFSVEYPEPFGELLLNQRINGYGSFDDDERASLLALAVELIEQRIAKGT